MVRRLFVEVCQYFDQRRLVKSKENSTLENPKISQIQIKFDTKPSKQQMWLLLRDCLILQSFSHMFDSCIHTNRHCQEQAGVRDVSQM